MSSLRDWFSNTPATDVIYEQIFSSFAMDIQRRQRLISQLRIQERQSAVTLYGLALWIVYLYLCVTNTIAVINRHARTSVAEKVPLYLGPFIILAVRYLVATRCEQMSIAEEERTMVYIEEQRSKAKKTA